MKKTGRSKSREQTNQAAGRALEYAVRRIEEALLQHDPSLAGTKAVIEQNKIVELDGSRNEFDLWVTVNPHTVTGRFKVYHSGRFKMYHPRGSVMERV